MSKRGFSLIELLVVMAIIGVLISAGVASFRYAQRKSRDTRREADLAIIKVALESYFTDHHSYPDEPLPFGSPLTDGAQTYLNPVPDDPTYNHHYCYSQLSNGYDYTLGADFETKDDITCP